MRSPWFLPLFAAAALLVAAPPPAAAGPRDPPRPQPAASTAAPGAPPGADPGADPDRSGPPANPRGAAKRQRLRQRIRAMRAWYLTDELRLDDATAGRLFPLLGQFDDRLDSLRQQGSQIRRALRREMGAARPDPAMIDRLVNDLLAHYEALYRVQRDRFTAVRRVVSPEQSAKLLLLLPQIDDAIRGQLKRAMRGDRGEPRIRGGAGGDTDDQFPDRPRKKRAGEWRREERRATGARFADPF